MAHATAIAPEPIHGGTVAQVLAEYFGPRVGSVLYRGRSGSQYLFSAGRPDCLRWVLAEDVALFSRRPDEFLIHEETRIDPERERWRTIEMGVAELRAQLAAAEPAAPAGRPHRGVERGRGRPRRSNEELQHWLHLHEHTSPRWTYSDIAVHVAKLDGEDPGGALGTAVRRFKGALGPDRCAECVAGRFPSAPEHRRH